MSQKGNALPKNDDLQLSSEAGESASALDAFDLEPPQLAKDQGRSDVDGDPLDFFADEDPSSVLDLPEELSAVTWRNPVALASADHARHSDSNASSETRALTALVLGVFSALVFFAVVLNSPVNPESFSSRETAVIESTTRPVTSFLARAVADRNIAGSGQEPPPLPQDLKTMVARPTIRGLTPAVPDRVSPRVSQPAQQAIAPRPTPQLRAAPTRVIESDPPLVPAVAKPSVASVDRAVDSGTTTVPAPAPLPAEAADSPSEVDVIERVLARYRAAFNVLDSGAAKAVWPSVDSRALGRAFDRLEAQNLEFKRCEMSVAGSNASVSCNGTARYVPKVGHRVSVVEPRQWKFELKKTGAEWIIDQVDAR
jgi:hypothetical protein